MTSHADTIRAAIENDYTTFGARLGHEALDALVAENQQQAETIQRLASEAEDMVLAAAYYEMRSLRDAAVAENQQQAREIEHLRDRAVCSGCGGDVAESGSCLRECGEGEMIPASDLPTALRAMRESRDEWVQESMTR